IAREAADIAAVAQILRPRCRVAVEAAQHVGDVAVDMVDEAPLEGWPLRPGQTDCWVDPLVAPAFAAAAEQPGMRRAAERGAPAPAHQAVGDVIVDRDQVPIRRRACRNGADLGGELRPDALVGIDFEDPLAMAGGDPGVAARPFALPFALDDAIGETGGDMA